MKLNKKKSSIMIFNFTYNYQFSTRLTINDTLLDIQKETKLLGVIITDDLSWGKNTSSLIKKAYARMQIIRKLYQFNIPIKDLVLIYIIYIRCYLEQSCVVWHASLTQQQSENLERVQRVALRIILKDQYEHYDQALKSVELETLSERREQLSLKFAKSCLKNEHNKYMFPLNQDSGYVNIPKQKYVIQQANTSRLQNSAIPYMQALLNKYNN